MIVKSLFTCDLGENLEENIWNHKNIEKLRQAAPFKEVCENFAVIFA
jgi:hypothetical protein